ncbi:hypothetical protein D044_0862B, partial [Vibrio parahaemolyticus EKP-026]
LRVLLLPPIRFSRFLQQIESSRPNLTIRFLRLGSCRYKSTVYPTPLGRGYASRTQYSASQISCPRHPDRTLCQRLET